MPTIEYQTPHAGGGVPVVLPLPGTTNIQISLSLGVPPPPPAVVIGKVEALPTPGFQVGEGKMRDSFFFPFTVKPVDGDGAPPWLLDTFTFFDANGIAKATPGLDCRTPRTILWSAAWFKDFTTLPFVR